MGERRGRGGMFDIELWLAGDFNGIAVSLFTPNWTLCADTF